MKNGGEMESMPISVVVPVSKDEKISSAWKALMNGWKLLLS